MQQLLLPVQYREDCIVPETNFVGNFVAVPSLSLPPNKPTMHTVPEFNFFGDHEIDNKVKVELINNGSLLTLNCKLNLIDSGFSFLSKYVSKPIS